MIDYTFRDYIPVLRLKQAEYETLPLLNGWAMIAVLPHVVVLPPLANDQETNRLFTGAETLDHAAMRVGKFWRGRPALVDVRFISSWASLNGGRDWLVHFLRAIRDNQGQPVPVATLKDMEGSRSREFFTGIIDNNLGVAIRLDLTDLGDDNLSSRVHRALLALALKPHECVVVVDMSGADFSSVDEIADTYRIYTDVLYDIGLWARVAFQGNTYPDTHPAKADQRVLIDRNDWLAWQEATSDPSFKERVLFSDFAADNAIFKFDKAKVAPIRHLRYSLENTWAVYRAAEGARDQTRMRELCAKLAGDVSVFAGRDFSWGDRWIDDCAFAGGRAGNSTTWRKVNLSHHLSRVLFDLSKIRGTTFAAYSYPPRAKQEVLPLRAGE